MLRLISIILLLGLQATLASAQQPPNASVTRCDAPVLDRSRGIEFRPQTWPRARISATTGFPDSFTRNRGIGLSRKALASPNVTTMSFQYDYDPGTGALNATRITLNFDELARADGTIIEASELTGTLVAPDGGLHKGSVFDLGGLSFEVMLKDRLQNLDKQILDGGAVFLLELCEVQRPLSCAGFKMNFTAPQELDAQMTALIVERWTTKQQGACIE